MVYCGLGVLLGLTCLEFWVMLLLPVCMVYVRGGWASVCCGHVVSVLSAFPVLFGVVGGGRGKGGGFICIVWL
jgi:hypothetical protein